MWKILTARLGGRGILFDAAAAELGQLPLESTGSVTDLELRAHSTSSSSARVTSDVELVDSGDRTLQVTSRSSSSSELVTSVERAAWFSSRSTSSAAVQGASAATTSVEARACSTVRARASLSVGRESFVSCLALGARSLGSVELTRETAARAWSLARSSGAISLGEDTGVQGFAYSVAHSRSAVALEVDRSFAPHSTSQARASLHSTVEEVDAEPGARACSQGRSSAAVHPIVEEVDTELGARACSQSRSNAEVHPYVEDVTTVGIGRALSLGRGSASALSAVLRGGRAHARCATATWARSAAERWVLAGSVSRARAELRSSVEEVSAVPVARAHSQAGARAKLQFGALKVARLASSSRAAAHVRANAESTATATLARAESLAGASARIAARVARAAIATGRSRSRSTASSAQHLRGFARSFARAGAEVIPGREASFAVRTLSRSRGSARVGSSSTVDTGTWGVVVLSHSPVTAVEIYVFPDKMVYKIGQPVLFRWTFFSLPSGEPVDPAAIKATIDDVDGPPTDYSYVPGSTADPHIVRTGLGAYSLKWRLRTDGHVTFRVVGFDAQARSEWVDDVTIRVEPSALPPPVPTP